MREYKKELRAAITNIICTTMDDAYRKDAQSLLLNNLLPLVIDKQNIAIYHAYGWEINLQLLIDYALGLGKDIFQPVASRQDKYMYFMPYDETQRDVFVSEANYSHHDNYVEWHELDIILLPLVGVDKAGNRLGKGGGYYDTTLSAIQIVHKKPILCGIGYHCQMVDSIPADKWDICLDYFVSEMALTEF